jgi:hypothetical protein
MSSISRSAEMVPKPKTQPARSQVKIASPHPLASIATTILLVVILSWIGWRLLWLEPIKTTSPTIAEAVTVPSWRMDNQAGLEPQRDQEEIGFKAHKFTSTNPTEPEINTIKALTSDQAIDSVDRERMRRAWEESQAIAKRLTLERRQWTDRATQTALKLWNHWCSSSESRSSSQPDPLDVVVQEWIARVRRGDMILEQLRGQERELTLDAAALARIPAPQPIPLEIRNPFAQPTQGEELHLEIAQGRISVLPLTSLLDLLKQDARQCLSRMSVPRAFESEVGPIGWFKLRYRLEPESKSTNPMMNSLAGVTQFTLLGWEAVPISELRGETWETALNPASDFGRAVRAYDPRTAAVTIWVDPRGFALYRTVRNHLHERGFAVAARPLPFGVAIRGSPGGSLSAAQ